VASAIEAVRSEQWIVTAADVREAFADRERLSLREWSERHRRWPDGSRYSFDPVPHLREVVDAYDDPSVEELTVVKPSQTGFTQGVILNAIGYHADHDPQNVLSVLPSKTKAETFSKKKLQGLIEHTPAVDRKIGKDTSSDTLTEKGFPGGALTLVGSRSASGFRMETIGRVFGDDVEGWKATAGGAGEQNEGDQVTLIRRRTDRVPDRKLVWVSTPTRNGTRIMKLYEEMERRGQWHVPCPHCGAMQVLTWPNLAWESEEVEEGYEPAAGEVLRGSTVHRPDTAHYVCEANGCRIAESEKRWMEERGEYLTEAGEPVLEDGVRTVGFWLRGALTITLPGSEWPRLIREFLYAKDYPDALRSFINLVLGEVFEEKGDAPPWRMLYERREDWPIGFCPDGVMFLTAGADVQKNRVEVFVWGWGLDKESWLIDHEVIPGDPYNSETWQGVTELLHRQWPHEDGSQLPIARLAVDTGYARDAVVDWARNQDRRVMLIKGDHWKNWTSILGSPSRSDVMLDGKRTGLQLWPVGGALIKQETYGFFRLDPPLDEGDPYPPGYIHLPKVDDEVVKQLTAEFLDTTEDKRGFTKRQWVKDRKRNEALDCRVYARAAAEQMGLSRHPRYMSEQAKKAREASRKRRDRSGREEDDRRSGGRWLDRRGGRGRGGGGWLD
jgi:phage terminase large subunit GpA-like protein